MRNVVIGLRMRGVDAAGWDGICESVCFLMGRVGRGLAVRCELEEFGEDAQ